MARTPQEVLADLAITFLCLLGLLALWVFVFVPYLLWRLLMFDKLKKLGVHKSWTLRLAAAVAILPHLQSVVEAAAPIVGAAGTANALSALGVLIALARLPGLIQSPKP